MLESRETAKYIRILSRSALLGGLSDELLSDEIMQFDLHKFGKASHGPGELTADGKFCILASGRLRLFSKDLTTGRELTTALIGPGEVFDVIALLEGAPRATNAEAIDKLEILSAPIAVMRDWISRHPEFNSKFVPYLAGMLSQLTELSVGLALHSTGIRLAKLLLHHLDPSTPTPKLLLINDLSTKDIAKLIGTVRGVVSRDIQTLKQLGILDSGRRRLEVKDVESLRRLVDGSDSF